MTTDYSTPPLRDLPTSRLNERKQHLLDEISGKREPRFSLPPFAFPRRRLVAVAAVAAACVAGVAVAASGGWLFSGHGPNVLGVTNVTLHGQSWRVALQQQAQPDGVTSLVVYASNGNTTSNRAFGETSLRFVLTPFKAMFVDVPGGRIWAGTTRNTIRSVSITYYTGRVYTTSTSAAPRATKTPYRYWALAVPGVAPAATLTTHDINGKSVRWRLR